MQVFKGDRVLFGKHSGQEVQVGDVSHVLLREAEILAKLEA